MAARKQAAQALAQKQAEITAQESLELVKCLLRVSIYHVSYLRGLFPDNSFKGVDMQNLDGMHIKMLLRKDDDEAKRLIDWVEGGVVDAIRKKYLNKLFFGFATDRDAKQLLEEYVFSFCYDDHGGVTMEMGATGSAKKFAYKHSQPTSQKPDVNTVKYQVVRLMRMLVGICQTLEKVPDERYLFMKLTYYGSTPDDYEPPFFEAAGDRAVGTFSRKPFTMHVGGVGTDHHQVNLHVKSVLDSMDAGLDGAVEPEPDTLSNSHQGTTTLSDTEMPQGKEESMGGFSPDQRVNEASKAKYTGQTKLDDLYTAPQDEGDATSCMVAAAPSKAPCDPAALDKVSSYAQLRSQVHLVDAMGFFMEMSAQALEDCFSHLVADGLLQPTEEKDVYNVKKNPTENEVIDKMGTLAVDAGKHIEMASEMGGVHSMAGTEATMSQAVHGNGKRKALVEADDIGSQPAANLWIDGTQPSQTGAPYVRKASMVEETIHQRAKKVKKEATAQVPKRMLRSTRMGSMAR